MAASQGIRAGRAFVELGVNDRVTAGLNKVAAKLKSFSAGVRATGLALSRPVQRRENRLQSEKKRCECDVALTKIPVWVATLSPKRANEESRLVLI